MRGRATGRRYSPNGTPEDVAEFLTPYIDAGCSAFNVIPWAADGETGIAAVGEWVTSSCEQRDHL